MTVAKVIKKKGNVVHSVAADDSISAAVRRYAETGARSLVVTDGPKLVGIITVKDVMRGLAEGGAGVLEAPVSELMSTQVIWVGVDDSLDDVEKVLLKHGFNHIPVLDGENLVGLVTLSDVVVRHLEDTNTENDDLRAYVYNNGYPI